MQNQITCDTHVFVARKKNLPLGNSFVQLSAHITAAKEIHALVQCDAHSKEPGRIYSCFYSRKGRLLGCMTVN